MPDTRRERRVVICLSLAENTEAAGNPEQAAEQAWRNGQH
jgi:hypothetical protein